MMWWVVAGAAVGAFVADRFTITVGKTAGVTIPGTGINSDGVQIGPSFEPGSPGLDVQPVPTLVGGVVGAGLAAVAFLLLKGK